MIAALINGFDELSGNYRIQLDNPPPYDRLPVAVELTEADGASAGLEQVVENAIKQALGVSARVSLLPPGTWELSVGKTRRVLRNYE
jgi:phenylacetate-CoA ligase